MIILLFIGWQSCSEPDDGIPSGSYSYTAYDSLHTKVITGWFTMLMDSDSTITGEWHFSNVGDVRDDIGPQLGDGTLAGFRTGDLISIGLNPDIVDNNVFLIGSEESGIIAGGWTWATIAGISNWGTFTALRHR